MLLIQSFKTIQLMKKLFTILAVSILVSLSSQANKLTIVNGTSITFTFQIQSYSGSQYCSGTIVIPPGVTVFNDPQDVPDLLSCGAQSTDKFVSLSGFCDPYDIGIFDPIYYSSGSQQTIGPGNACNNGISFMLNWLNPSGDGFITIN